MRKYVMLFIFCASPLSAAVPVCNVPQQYQQERKGPLGQQLLNAAKKNTPTLFRSLLMQAVKTYKGNKEEFFNVINMRDEDSFNIILYASLINDLENLAIIFDALEEFYKNDPEGAFEYLITRDKRGLSVLGLAEYGADQRIVELILMRAMNLIGSNKKLFFKFITAADHEGNRPLGDAVFDAEFRNVEMMVKVAAHILGKDSPEFKEFLNVEESSGNNALSYAHNIRIKLFLEKYGAEMPVSKTRLKAANVQAEKYGLALNEASNHYDFKKFKELLSKAKDFKEDDYAAFTYFSARNGAGWNPFINTAADGQYKYLKALLKTVDSIFDKEDKETKSLLLSNADFEGRTPLHLAILRRHWHVGHLLIDTVTRYAINKPFLYAVLSVANELNGFTPFINAIYASGQFDDDVYDFIKFFIERAENLFGRDSRMFYLFLNTRDYNGWNPLSYASDDQLKKLLKSYGAIDTPMPRYKGVGKFKKLELEGDM
ncbi:MAG: hypothetical protein AB7R69_01320 [Candidatus Babeliales bacterium]